MPGVGDRVRELREQRKWTQKELAQRVGKMDHSAVSNIERGAIPLGRARAVRMVDAFNAYEGGPRLPKVTLKYLLGEGVRVTTVDDLLRRLESFAAEADEERKTVARNLARLARSIERLEARLGNEVAPAQKRA